VPVHERPIRILLPRPDVKRDERGESEAVGTLEVMKELAHQLRRSRVTRIPSGSDNQKVGAGQLQMSVWLCLVDHNLRTRGIQHPASHERSVHIVESHCPSVWSAHAAKLKLIAFRLSH